MNQPLTNRPAYAAWLWYLTRYPMRDEIQALGLAELALEQDLLRIRARWHLARMVDNLRDLIELLDTLDLWPAPPTVGARPPRPSFNSRIELMKR